MKLNVTAQNPSEEHIKAYLEQNANERLAEKINNGTLIEKDGNTLRNKKTLDGFMTYATEEARKLAEKGARYACIEDATVFGWAIHYFEEDTIIGTLYNPDGTPYKPTKATTKEKPKTIPKNPTKAENKPTTPKANPMPTPTPKKAKTTDITQMSIFDLL